MRHSLFCKPSSVVNVMAELVCVYGNAEAKREVAETKRLPYVMDKMGGDLYSIYSYWK